MKKQFFFFLVTTILISCKKEQQILTNEKTKKISQTDIAKTADNKPAFTATYKQPGVNGKVIYFSFKMIPPAGEYVSSYHWDFGDGYESSVATVTHTYSGDKSYTVTLDVTLSEIGSTTVVNSYTMTKTVKTAVIPVADFDITTPVDPTTVYGFMKTFINKSSNVYGSSIWNLGDGSGTVSTEFPSVNRDYTMGGNYNVTLKITSITGHTATITKSVSIPYDLIADFDGWADGRFGIFYNSSKNAAACSWSFGDGDTIDSNNARIVHHYASPGDYIVTLVVTGKDGSARARGIKLHID